MLYRQPVGRHVIKVCRNIACSLLGAERLLEHLKTKLGIGEGETTADGRFTLLTVECLASCGTAPAMQVNDTYHERLNEAEIDRILQGLA
jgi:NADH-quinone oxidoreductase subunit E